jgi:hypothetical protein
MGSRFGVLMTSAVVALTLAATALAAHVETSPSVTALYAGNTSSGVVAFTFVDQETGCIPCGKSHDVITLGDFRFRDACTKQLTRIHKPIAVRRKRFSYRRGSVSITGTIAYRPNTELPTVNGRILPADADCDGDADGYATFDLKPPS